MCFPTDLRVYPKSFIGSTLVEIVRGLKAEIEPIYPSSNWVARVYGSRLHGLEPIVGTAGIAQLLPWRLTTIPCYIFGLFEWSLATLTFAILTLLPKDLTTTAA
jgi:hypothetical protein